MATVAFSLGSNMGDRRYHLDQGIDHLIVNCGLVGVRVSSFYETDPVGYTEQEPFMNCVVAGRTAMEPMELLDTIHRIEADMKRVRDLHWGPRTLDIDILLYDDRVLDDPELTVPHPRMTERAFVLIPLLEIWPDAAVQGRLLSEYLPELSGQGVRKLSE